MAQPLARSKVFPQLMVDLIKIGEETGDVPGALHNLAETYEAELDIALRVMTNMIEPVIMCVMAMGVGFLLISRAVGAVRHHLQHFRKRIRNAGLKQLNLGLGWGGATRQSAGSRW